MSAEVELAVRARKPVPSVVHTVDFNEETIVNDDSSNHVIVVAKHLSHVEDQVDDNATAHGKKSHKSLNFKIREFLATHLTYYRIHLLYYLFLGFLGSVIIYGIENGRFAYVDCLFQAFSAVCVTGLITIDTSQMKLGSTIVLYVLLFLGSTVMMACVPPFIRRYYFDDTIKTEIENLPEGEAELIKKQRGIEYSALTYVILITFCYCILLQLIFGIMWGIYFTFASTPIQIMARNNVNPFYFGFFQSTSSFANGGFSLLNDNYMQLADDYFFLLSCTFLILCGNVCAPIFLRLITWIVYSCSHIKSPGLLFLLETPRRCFTHMFPYVQTRLLLIIVIVTTLFEFFMFLILDMHLPYWSAASPYTDGFALQAAIASGYNVSDPNLPPFNYTGPEVVYTPPIVALVGYFQAVSTRTAGFNAIDLSQISPAMQLLYIFMMYLASYPFAITLRKSREASSEEVAAVVQTKDIHVAAQKMAMNKLASEAAENEGASPTKAAAASEALKKDLESLESGALTPVNSEGGEEAGEPKELFELETTNTEDYLNRPIETEWELLDPEKLDRGSFLSQASDIMLSEIAWLALALFVISIAESSAMMNTQYPSYFNVFTVLFELISAFGTVGLSIGFPGTTVSLSAQFSTFSKLVVIVTMIAGRHRGLPFSIDPAVYLPSLFNLPETSGPQPVSDSIGRVKQKLFSKSTVENASVNSSVTKTVNSAQTLPSSSINASVYATVSGIGSLSSTLNNTLNSTFSWNTVGGSNPNSEQNSMSVRHHPGSAATSRTVALISASARPSLTANTFKRD
jgi:Trk-type K+ transport system membrane component